MVWITERPLRPEPRVVGLFAGFERPRHLGGRRGEEACDKTKKNKAGSTRSGRFMGGTSKIVWVCGGRNV